jgi:hypothetical protein
MAAVVAPSQIRTLRPEVHTGELDCLKPGARQQLWYTVLGLGLAVGAFFTAWRLHGSASSTYRIDNQWSALTGLFILALAIERALEPFSRKLGPDTTKRRVKRDEALAGPRGLAGRTARRSSRARSRSAAGSPPSSPGVWRPASASSCAPC